MSVKHLGSGSVEPSRTKGLLRVYSHQLCPFAERARLVLKLKRLPHDIVNIDLQDKPDWYLKIHPKGQVPALLDGDEIVIESLDIADYLDTKYSTDNASLYPTDPQAKTKDQQVIRTLIGQAVGPLGRVQYSQEPYTVEKALEELLPGAQLLEDELAKRGQFFGGNKPGMIDYMLWPWAERSAILPKVLGVEKLPLKEDQIPKLRQWAKDMLKVPEVKEIATHPDILFKAFEARKNNALNINALLGL